MSQYPSPYTPPPQQPNYESGGGGGGGYDFSYYQPMQDPLAPAKRASVLMFMLGGLIVLPSFCCAAMGLALPAMMAQQPGAFGEFTASGMTPEFAQRMLFVGGAIGLFVGVVMIVLGRFVRRGSMGAAVTSIVLVVLIVLYLLLNAVGLLVMRLPGPQMVLGLVMTVLGLALFGLLIMWLIQAAMAASRVATMQSQYQQQLWQYQQQQQMYQSGYVAPPMPPMVPAPAPQQPMGSAPPPVPPAPPAPPDDPSREDPHGPVT